MKKVRTTRNFDKQYIKLNPKLKKQFQRRLLDFLNSPELKSLNNHPLRGKYKGYWSINVSGDLRALYYEQGNTVVIFAFIGTHGQLYG